PVSATEILVGRQKRYSSSLLSISATSFVRSCVIPQTNNTHQGVTRFPTSSLTTTTLRNMSRDVSSQSNIAISKTTDQDGSFNRRPSTFRDVIEKGGKHEPEKGRYHLYVSYACPWAHRTLIMRKLKGLEDFIDVTVVSPRMGEHGWPFANVDPYPGAGPDPVAGAEHIKDLYLKASQIVNNESSEIIRILNTAFNELIPADKAALDFYPEQLRSEIDASHEWIYPTINNGVYRSGFATSQGAYETAVKALF
ncbi:13184_t:CDS:2, partial [Acaulospora colombiana]